MIPTDTSLILFDIAGFMLTIASIAIVANSSVLLMGRIRRGLLALISGLTLIAASFLWSILFVRIGIADWPNFQSVLLSSGMALFLFSASKLFTLTRGSKI